MNCVGARFQAAASFLHFHPHPLARRRGRIRARVPVFCLLFYFCASVKLHTGGTQTKGDLLLVYICRFVWFYWSSRKSEYPLTAAFPEVNKSLLDLLEAQMWSAGFSSSAPFYDNSCMNSWKAAGVVHQSVFFSTKPRPSSLILDCSSWHHFVPEVVGPVKHVQASKGEAKCSNSSKPKSATVNTSV